MPSVEADPNAAGYAWSAFLTKGENHKRHNENHKRHKKTRVLCFLGSRLCFSCTFPVVIGNYSAEDQFTTKLLPTKEATCLAECR